MKAMLRNCALLVSSLMLPQSAHALVGVSQPGGAAGAHTVMVLKASRSGPGNCTGVIIAPRTILTAAHCVAGAMDIAIYVSKQATPSPLRSSRIAVHPQYVPDAIRKRVRSIDLALIRTSAPLPAAIAPIRISAGEPVRLDQQFIIAGFGVRDERDPSLDGELRAGKLAARSPLSSILLWAADPSRRGLGACTGDSGGPIFDATLSSLIAITVWSTGSRGSKCGEITQGILVGPQKAWIEKTLRQWGGR